jgi:hypothetical protein
MVAGCFRVSTVYMVPETVQDKMRRDSHLSIPITRLGVDGLREGTMLCWSIWTQRAR